VPAGRLTGLALAVACALIVWPAAALAAGSGSFSSTGPMSIDRGGAVAAPLPDGRVLVAGGRGSDGYRSSAEIFNPTTGSFSATGSMGTPRERASAAPLPDGRVLVAGGFTGSMFLKTAEIYDPSTGTFSPVVAQMAQDRGGAAAVPLPDGRVLIAGGSSAPAAELFNPATSSFTTTGSIGPFRGNTAGAPLPDGRALIVGGEDNGDEPLATALIYDPGTGTFAPTGSMTVARITPAAAPLPDGRVLVGGGSGPSSVLASAEVFDPVSGSFSSGGIGSLGEARSGAAAAKLGDGRVLVAGGFGNENFLSSAEIFAATNTFSYALKGRNLFVTIEASGEVAVSDAASALTASSAKKKKRVLLLKPARASGNPPTITLRLPLTKAGKSRLKRRGKVKVRARITFTPQGGLANTQLATLKLKTKRRK
jgi:hypothetical protein